MDPGLDGGLGARECREQEEYHQRSSHRELSQGCIHGVLVVVELLLAGNIRPLCAVSALLLGLISCLNCGHDTAAVPLVETKPSKTSGREAHSARWNFEPCCREGLRPEPKRRKTNRERVRGKRYTALRLTAPQPGVARTNDEKNHEIHQTHESSTRFVLFVSFVVSKSKPACVGFHVPGSESNWVRPGVCRLAPVCA